MPDDPITRAASVLIADGIIAHYTDTVIGLACLPKQDLLLRLAELKQRSQQMGFILLTDSLESLASYITYNNDQQLALEKKTNKPTTWLVKANNDLPPLLTGNSDKLAIRVSQHENVASLCERVGPIVSTSANLHGQPNCLRIQNVRNLFGPSIDYVHVSNDHGTQQASSIIDLESKQVIRD